MPNNIKENISLMNKEIEDFFKEQKEYLETKNITYEI